MKLLIFEYLTGGGLAGQPLPPSLMREGSLMVEALLRDLSQFAHWQLTTVRDPRLPALAGYDVQPARVGEVADWLPQLARGVNAAWLIAPETGGILENLTRRLQHAGVRTIGCDADAIALTASKSRTALHLLRNGVAALPAHDVADELPVAPGPWVIKRDDGAGCEGMRIVANGHAAAAVLRASAGQRLVAQPWISGDALSLSLLCTTRETQLLSCNRQHVRIEGGGVRLAGITVNVPVPHGGLDQLAQEIHRALPGLRGYVGVDLIVHPFRGPLVIEINPRLTTSYCGLAAALGRNIGTEVARHTLGLEISSPAPARQTRSVEVSCEFADA